MTLSLWLATDLETPLQTKKQRGKDLKEPRALPPASRRNLSKAGLKSPTVLTFWYIWFVCLKNSGRQFGHWQRWHPTLIHMALKPGRALCSPKPESETIHEIMQNRNQSFKVDLSWLVLSCSFFLCHALPILPSDIMLLRPEAMHKANRLETPSRRWTAWLDARVRRQLCECMSPQWLPGQRPR